MLIPLSAGVLTRLVSEYGEEAVAGFGVGARIESLAMIGILALNTALMPFVGQNYGAGKKERVKTAVKFSNRFSLLWGVAVFLLLALSAPLIARLFNSDPEVIRTVELYLWIIPLSYGFEGIAFMLSSAFNAVNKPLCSAAILFIRLFIFAVPLAYLGSMFIGLSGIFIAISVANIFIGLIAYFWGRRFFCC